MSREGGNAPLRVLLQIEVTIQNLAELKQKARSVLLSPRYKLMPSSLRGRAITLSVSRTCGLVADALQLQLLEFHGRRST